MKTETSVEGVDARDSRSSCSSKSFHLIIAWAICLSFATQGLNSITSKPILPVVRNNLKLCLWIRQRKD